MKMLSLFGKSKYLFILLLFFCNNVTNTICNKTFKQIIEKKSEQKKQDYFDSSILDYDNNTSIIKYNNNQYCLKYFKKHFVCLYKLDNNSMPLYNIRSNGKYLTIYKIAYNSDNVEVIESKRKIEINMLKLKFCDFIIFFEKEIKKASFENQVLLLPNHFIKTPLWKEIRL